MKDDCSAVNESSLSWHQRFERVMWLKSVGDFTEAQKLLKNLADEAQSKEDRALCLLWITEVDHSYHFEFGPYPKKLLKLSVEVVRLLYGGYTDRFEQPNQLLMRAFLLMAKARYCLGQYRECIFALTQAVGCMAPSDAEAVRFTTSVISLIMQAEDSEQAKAKERQDLWNCEKRHEGPEDCAKDKHCPRPSLDDQQAWIRSFWGCPNDHLPEECHYGECAGTPSHYTEDVWEQMQPVWDIIDAR